MADWPRYIAICLVYLALAKTSRRHLLQKPSPICEFFEPCFLSSVATASGAARNHHWAGQKHWSSQTDPNIQYTYTVSYIYISYGETWENFQQEPSNGTDSNSAVQRISPICWAAEPPNPRTTHLNLTWVINESIARKQSTNITVGDSCDFFIFFLHGFKRL